MTRSILIVDDDRGMRETLVAALELDGYDVIAAPDGVAALEMIAAEPPALIILDLMMPRMDGYTFAARLAERGLRPQIQLLVLTADGRAAEKAALVGADGWLSKPFDLSDLLERVSALVE